MTKDEKTSFDVQFFICFLKIFKPFGEIEIIYFTDGHIIGLPTKENSHITSMYWFPTKWELPYYLFVFVSHKTPLLPWRVGFPPNGNSHDG